MLIIQNDMVIDPFRATTFRVFRPICILARCSKLISGILQIVRVSRAISLFRVSDTPSRKFRSESNYRVVGTPSGTTNAHTIRPHFNKQDMY